LIEIFFENGKTRKIETLKYKIISISNNTMTFQLDFKSFDISAKDKVIVDMKFGEFMKLQESRVI